MAVLKRSIFEAKVHTVARDSGSLYRRLDTHSHLPPAQAREMEDDWAVDIVRYAMAASPYYEQRYASAGIDAADLRDSSVIQRLPIIERSDVKNHVDQFWCRDVPRKYVRDAKTSGSTGQPLRTGNDARVPLSVLSWRMYSWWGVSPWDNTARVGRWGLQGASLRRNSLRWWPTRQVFLDAGYLDEASLHRFADEVTAVRPRLIEGYLGAVRTFGEFLRDTGRSIPAPVAIGTTAAPLTDPVRRHIQELFAVPVFDQYRCSEIPWMAGECRERSGLHVFSDMRRIEVVNSEGRLLPPGETGDIVVTDLTNRVFPFIRYKLGDRGKLLSGECPCGVSLPRIAPPDGRTADMILLPDGTVIAGGLMTLFSTEPDAVSLFQLHQHADFSITVRVVLTDAPGAREAVDRAVDSLRKRLQGKVPVRVEEVTNLPFTRGKIQYVTSEIPPPDPT